MLVIHRKKGESIQIGPDIDILVTEIDRGQVKLAIRAPRDVRVMRTELLAAPSVPKEAAS